MKTITFLLLVITIFTSLMCDSGNDDSNSNNKDGSQNNTTNINDFNNEDNNSENNNYNESDLYKWNKENLAGRWKSNCYLDGMTFRQSDAYYYIENNTLKIKQLHRDYADDLCTDIFAEVIVKGELSIEENIESVKGAKRIQFTLTESYWGLWTTGAGIFNEKNAMGNNDWSQGEMQDLFGTELSGGTPVYNGLTFFDAIKFKNNQLILGNKEHCPDKICIKIENTPTELSDVIYTKINNDPLDYDLNYGLKEVTEFGSNPGNLKMFNYIPDTLTTNAPLVVVLHGCFMSSFSMTKAGWNKLADTHGFAVIYPQQKGENCSNSIDLPRCFNFFIDDEINKTSNEPTSIKQMIDYTFATQSIDASKVFITGFAGGATMALVMMATYPEVFNSAGIITGMPIKCALTENDLLTKCANVTNLPTTAPYIEKTSSEWGNLVQALNPEYTGAYPKLSIWHGSEDTVIHPEQMTEILKQWSHVHGIDTTADSSSTIDQTVAHSTYENNSGEVIIETNLVNGLGHAIPVNPDSAQIAGGCGEEYTLFESSETCSTYRIAEFWGILN